MYFTEAFAVGAIAAGLVPILEVAGVVALGIIFVALVIFLIMLGTIN